MSVDMVWISRNTDTSVEIAWMALTTCNHGQVCCRGDGWVCWRPSSFTQAEGDGPMRFQVVPSVWKQIDPIGNEEVSTVLGSASPAKIPTLPWSERLLTANAESKSGVAMNTSF